jgi:protein TonB
VALLNTTLNRFFALSIAIHISVLAWLMVKAQPLHPTQQPESIAVSLLPPAEKKNQAPSRAPKAAPASRAAKAPTIVAKNEKTVSKETAAPLREKALGSERIDSEPAPREAIQEKTVVAERPLPTLKELLPSVTYSATNERASGPISLNTKDPLYVSYFNKIKQTIEQHWEYPEMALRYGLQGRLALEFTINGGGQLEGLRLIRSSGSQLLDEEALRAVKAAAPFPPIPSWIKPIPLLISASMEYHDNRLNYRFNR